MEIPLNLSNTPWLKGFIISSCPCGEPYFRKATCAIKCNPVSGVIPFIFTVPGVIQGRDMRGHETMRPSLILSVTQALNPAISILCIFSREILTLVHKEICTGTLTAVLLITVGNSKQSKCPPTEAWMSRLWYSHMTDYYTAVKMNYSTVISLDESHKCSKRNMLQKGVHSKMLLHCL